MQTDPSVSAPAPWYRHRWPWLLMSGPVTAIVAGGITMWLAVTGNTALVADDYYKQGLTINRVLEREQAAEEMGLESTITATHEGSDSTRLEIRLRAGEAVALPSQLRVTLIHPTRNELDRELLLDGRDGRYSGVIRALQATHWKMVIEDDARTWRLPEALTVGESGGR